MAQKVIVGISGGVDSSVAALLLQAKSYDVTGVFMKNWEEDDDDHYCAAEDDIKDGKAICKKIGIPFKKINFSAEYWDHVFEYFLKEYRAGRTPNPDILCNKEIKFKAFIDYARHLGSNYIATGHYVRKRRLDNGEYQLLKGIDAAKDQSYFLYTLGQHQLECALFPVGTLKKTEVRTVALKHGLITHNKKDSTGICFIGERRFKAFLSRYLPAEPGDICDENGVKIGQHDGLMYYTIGQRQGLGIGGVKNRPEIPWFVTKKDLKNNVLTVVQGHDHPLLLTDNLTATDLHWVKGSPPASTFICRAKTRYRQADQDCSVVIDDLGKASVSFKAKQRAVTLGQSVVFYQDDVCLGGGIIT